MASNILNRRVVFCVILLVIPAATSSYGQDASCTFSVSPTEVYFQPFGGTGEVYVKGSAPTCTFNVKTAYPWIALSVKQEGGEGKVLLTVDGNTGTTHRVGSVTIGGQGVAIIQYGLRISGGG